MERPGSPIASPRDEHASLGFLGRLLLLLVCTLCLFAGPMERSGWAMDDVETIAQNPIVTGERPAWHAFTQDYWHHMGDAGLYRPLVTLSLRWNWSLLGPDPGSFHRVNLLLHCAVVLAAGLFIRNLRRGGNWPWLGLVLFAMHPVQSEAVVWIAGRSSSLCALLGLLPLVFCTRKSSLSSKTLGLWAFGGVLLPLLVKEDGLAFAALWWFLPLGDRMPRRLAVIAAVLCVAALRFWALGTLGADAAHAALAGAGFLDRVPLGLGILGKALGGLLWPPLVLGTVDGSGLAWQLLGAAVLAALVLAAVRAVLGGRTVEDSRGLGLAWFCAMVIALLPCLHWFAGPELFGPRFLYLPLLLLAPALAWPFDAPLKSPVALLLGAGVLTLGLMPAVGLQSAGFVSPMAYWQQRTRFRAQDPRSWNGLANAMLSDPSSNPRHVEEALRKAIELDGSYSRPHVGLAHLARKNSDVEAERRHLERALELAPRNPVAWANLGSVHLRKQDFGSARRAYQRATKLQPGRDAFWRGLARAHFGLDEYEPAKRCIGKALELNPGGRLNREVRDLILPRAKEPPR